MRALIKKVFPDGTTRPGSEHNRLTKHYRSFATLYRYAILPALQAWDGRARVELYYGDMIYGEPDKIFSYNRHIIQRVKAL